MRPMLAAEHLIGSEIEPLRTLKRSRENSSGFNEMY